MSKFRSVCILGGALTVMLAWSGGGQAPTRSLEALKFLEGTYHGKGQSPFGPYEFEASNERRGRWLLGTSSVYAPGTDRMLIQSTGVIGHDDRGLVMYAFENAGVVVFRGELTVGGVRFEWKEGDAYRRRTIQTQPDGKLANREESYLPAQSPDKLVFESVSIRGKRERK